MQLSKELIPKGSHKIPAVCYYLDNMEKGKKYPLVVFCHGNGENGSPSDYDKVLIENLVKITGKAPDYNTNHKSLLANAEANQGLVLAPHFIQAYNDWRPEWAGGVYVNTVIDWAIQNLPVDPSRIYLTGLSGGGGACWDYISLKEEYCNKIAAVAPICGTEQSGLRDWSLVAKTTLPVWAFHAQDDTVVHVGATIRQVNLVNSFDPNPLANKSIYNTGGHGIWGKVYSDPVFYDWLFSQDRDFNSPVWTPNKRITRQDGSTEDIYMEDI